MKWEQSTTTSGGKTTISLTDEAKKRLRVKKDTRWKYDEDGTGKTWPETVMCICTIVFVVGAVAVLAVKTWAHVFGGA